MKTLTLEILQNDENLVNALVKGCKISKTKRGDGTFVAPLTRRHSLPSEVAVFGKPVSDGQCRILPNILPEDIQEVFRQVAAAKAAAEKERRRREDEERRRWKAARQAAESARLDQLMADRVVLPVRRDRYGNVTTEEGSLPQSFEAVGYRLHHQRWYPTVADLSDTDGNNAFYARKDTSAAEVAKAVVEHFNLDERLVDVLLSAEEPVIRPLRLLKEAVVRERFIGWEGETDKYYDSRGGPRTQYFRSFRCRISWTEEVWEAECVFSNGLSFTGKVTAARLPEVQRTARDAGGEQELREWFESFEPTPIPLSEVHWGHRYTSGSFQHAWLALRAFGFHKK